MSTGQVSAGYTLGKQARVTAVRPSRRIRKEQKMKLSLKQRFRNWLMKEEVEEDYISHVVETDRLSSEGLRLQIYKASGGYVVETRSYDSHKDRHHNTMHIISDEQDLGDSLGKIVMMEALKR